MAYTGHPLSFPPSLADEPLPPRAPRTGFCRVARRPAPLWGEIGALVLPWMSRAVMERGLEAGLGHVLCAASSLCDAGQVALPVGLGSLSACF